MTTNEPQPLPPTRPTPQARQAYADLCEAMAAHADDPWKHVGFSESEVRQIVAEAGSTIGKFTEDWLQLRKDQND